MAAGDFEASDRSDDRRQRVHASEFTEVETDQSFVRQALSDMERLVEAFPVRGDPDT
jgi:outer membrane protein assembly factor BamD (BamD/ComL family)